MSKPTPPRSPTPLQTTRQQLDELDALLQRMLELPVNQLEEDPAGTEEIAVTPALDEEPIPALPEPLPDASASYRFAELGHPPEDAMLLVSDGEPPPRPVEVPAPPDSTPRTDPGPRFVNYKLLTRISEPSESRPARRTGESPPVSVWLLPLLWTNQLFDACLGLLGPPGRWLQLESARRR